MPRILHLIASNSMGGPEKQLLHHARNMRSAKYDIVLGSFQDNSEVPEFVSLAGRCGIETVSIPGGMRPGLVEDLARYLRQHDIDMVCAHGKKANVIGHFAAKHADIPFVPFVHGYAEEQCHFTVYDRLERTVLTRSPQVVCTSRAQARGLARARRGRLAPLVIQNAVLPPRECDIAQPRGPDRTNFGSNGRSFVFGTVGRLNREKGHRFLLDAFAQLLAALPEKPIELLVLGEGPEEASLRAQARKLGLDSRVCFAGCRQKATSWIKAADCVVSPAVGGGVPNAVLEAMFLGVPVIATSIADLPDLIQSGDTGILVDPESPSSLADAMKKMVRFPEMRKQFAYAAKRHVSHNFSPAKQRAMLESLYETMLGRVFADEDEHVVA